MIGLRQIGKWALAILATIAVPCFFAATALEMPAQNGAYPQPSSGSGSTAALAPNQNPIYLSPNCGTQTNCYPIKATGGYDCGSSWTVSNTTIALSSNATRNFTSSDVGTIAWGAAYPCGAAIESGIPIQIAKTTIASVTDATHAVLSGSGPTNNCTAGGEGNCTFVWGDIDETAALAAAYQAATASPADCKFLYLPQGVIFVSGIIQASSICGGPGNATAAGTTSGGVIGVGERGSVIAMEPGFSAAGCPSTCTAFFNELQGVLFKDFSINGFGANITNVPSSLTLLQIGNDSLADNVGLYAIATTQSNIIGFAASGIAGENGYTRNVHVAGVGANECVLNANTVNWAPYCIGGSFPLVMNGTGNVYTYGGNFGFVSSGTFVAQANSSAVWFSNGDQFYFEHYGQPLVEAAHAFLSNDTLTLTGTGQALASSGTVTLSNTTIAAPLGTAVFSNSGDAVIDACGNKISGSTIFGGTGALFGSCSTTGTSLATGNVALTSGWGSGTTVSAASGDSHSFQFTITLAGTSSSGSIATVTFPTAYLVAPQNCIAAPPKGTDASLLTSVVVGTPTATTVAITYNGTLTAADTIIQGMVCQ